MQRNGSRMKAFACLMMLPLLVTACAPVPSGDAVCTGTLRARAEHAAALVADGGDMSVVTGDRLIRMIEAGCGE